MKKIVKKLFSLLLVLIILLGCMPKLNPNILKINTLAAETVPDGYTGIYSASDFYNIRNKLNGRYILMNDIDLEDYTNWTPIGSSSDPFKGTLNGNGHKISNITISDHTNMSYYGLFGYVNSASFSSLTIENISIKIENSNYSLCVGSILGYSSSNTSFSNITITNASILVDSKNSISVGTIGGSVSLASLSNIQVAGNIVLNSSSTTLGGAFGNISSSDNKTFSDVKIHVDMDINATSLNFGGFTGHFDSNAYNKTVYFKNIMTAGDINIYATNTLRASGIIGYCSGEPLDIFQHCQSSMNINIDATGATSYIGGILAHGTTWDGVEFYNCGFSGNISEIASSTTVYFGGIVGYYYQAYGLSSTYTSQCYNSGSLSLTGSSKISNAYLGGLIGFVDADGYYTQTLTNCFNCGDISATNCSTLYIGGVVAALYGYTVTVSEAYTTGTIQYSNVSTASESNFRGSYNSEKNCYYIEGGNCKTAGTGTMLTSSEFKKQENLAGFDFSSTWTYSLGSGYEYPVLKNTPFNATLLLNSLATGASVLEYSTLQAIENAALISTDNKIRIEAEGYYTAEFSDPISSVDEVTIYGLVPESTNSHISAVHCNNMDALVNSEYVKFPINGSSTTDKEKDVQIHAYTDLSEWDKFQLIYEGIVIEESDTGIFDLKAKDIPCGDPLMIRVIDKNGIKHQKINTNIKTYEVTWTWSLAENKFEITIPKDITFLGGTTFSLDLSTLPVFIIKDEDTIKIGLGASETSEFSKLNGKTTSSTESSDLSTLWKDWKKIVTEQKYKHDIAESLTGLIIQESIQKFEGLNLKGCSVFDDKSSEIDANIAAYLELKYVDGKCTTVGADGFMSVKGNASSEWQAVVFYVPIVFAIAGAIEAEADFDIGYDFDNAKVVYNADVDITIPEVKGSAGIGIAKVFNGSGYIDLNNKFKLDIGNKITGTLTGELGISGKFVFFSAEKSLWKFADWEYLNIPLNNTTSTIKDEYKMATLKLCKDEIVTAENNLYNKSAYSLDSRDYLSTQSEWYGDINIQSFALDENVKQDKLLQESIYDLADPLIATTDDGTTIMVWITDLSERSTGNHTAVVYSVYDPKFDTWSSPQIVSDDGTADAFVNISTNQGDVYLTWVNSNMQFDANVEIEEFASSCEICIAKYNRTSNVFEEITTITNNDCFDFMPSVYADSDSIYLSYIENINNDALMLSGTNIINLIKMKNGCVENVLQYFEDSPILSSDISKINDKITVAYTKDLDGDLTTTSDVELYTINESNDIFQITNNSDLETNIKFYDVNGSNALTYYSNNSINYTYDFSNIHSIINNDAIQTSPNYMFVNDSEGTLLLSALTMQGETASNIYASTWDGFEWSGTSKVSNSDKNIKSFFGSANNDGNIDIVYTTSDFEDIITEDKGDGSYSGTYTESVSMFFAPFHRTYDVELLNIFFEDNDVIPGSELPTIVTIKNNGLYTIEKLNISYECNNFEYSELIDTQIKPGETANVKYNISVPSSLTTLSDIKFVVSCDNDSNSNNNYVFKKIGYTDISLRLEKYTSVNTSSVGLYISNMSAFATGATIVLHRGTYTGEVVSKFKVTDIDKYSTEYLYLNSNIINENFNHGEAVCIEVIADGAEISHGDNSQFFIVETPKVEQYEYVVLGENKIMITAYNGFETDLQIPSTYDDYIVSSIDDYSISSRIESIILPETIETINPYAFDDATSLKSIAISENNTNYCSVNGVLYSYDKTQLVRCPISYNNDLLIFESTTNFSENAFYLSDVCILNGTDSINVNLYHIISEKDLQLLTGLVNSGYSFKNKTIQLESDIELSSTSMVPIGKSDTYPFSGVFNGNNHTISGFNYQTNNMTYAGFFGYIKNGGVKNLTIEGSITGCRNVGMCAGYMLDSVLYNCQSKGQINCIGSGSYGYVGGLVGTALHSVIINCAAETNINTNFDSIVYYVAVGGIAGVANVANDEPMCILNSFCNGEITVDSSAALINNYYVGGIAGYLGDDAANNYYYGTINNPSQNSDICIGYNFGYVEPEYTSETEYNGIGMIVVHNNYYPEGKNAIGLITEGNYDTTDWTVAVSEESFSKVIGEGSLVDILNGNKTNVEDIIVAHRDILSNSTWSELVDRINGDSFTVSNWKIGSNNLPVNYECDCYKHAESEWVIDVEATCTNEGSKHTYCLVCQETVTTSIIEKAEHKFSDWTETKAATCTEKGSEYRICTTCNSETETRNIAELGHNFEGEWSTYKTPTCTVDGSSFRTCSRCKSEKETRTVDKLGHDFESKWTVDKEATCTKVGSKSHHCSRCDEKSNITTINKIAHTYKESVQEATCTKDGKKTYNCSACGDSYSEVITAKGHTDNNSDYKCDNGCGYEYEKPAPDTTDDPSANCSCNCHKGGFMGFIWKIINFFNKLFKSNRYCACGVAHY